MTRHALTQVGSYAVVIAGLLAPTLSYAASNSPYDQSGTNPAQSNCDSKTGCASYATGDVTNKNPQQQTSNSNSPYDQSGTNPAQSNCDSKTGCASYATGGQTKTNPAQPMQQQQTAPTQPMQQQK